MLDTEFLIFFRQNYPEFNNEPNLKTDEQIKNTYNEINLIYPEVRGIEDDKTKAIVAGYVVAHYLTMLGTDTGAGATGGGGAMLSSASIGEISISTQSPPVSDMFAYFFGSTPYGLKFLAYLASVGGLRYVN